MSNITKFIIKRRTKDESWDVRKLVTDVKLTTDMNYSAGELDFNLIEVNDGFSVHNGDIVIFNWNHNKTFFGYIFNYELNKGGSFKVTAYDKMRYLKSTDSIMFPVSTLGQRFNTICNFLEVKHKVMANPNHKLKSEIADDKTYFSMLQSAIDKTRRATGEHFFLRDNYGTIELRKYPHYQIKFILGDKSLVTDYTFSRSIENTANVIKVVKTSEIKGKKKVTTVKSVGKGAKKHQKKSTKTITTKEGKKIFTKSAEGGTVEKWGKLVYTKNITSKTNAAQMKQEAQNLLKQKNKQENQLKISAIGNVYLQAGNSVMVKIKDLSQIGVGTKKYLIKKAIHNFGDKYTVDLELRI
ncbi:hypothetical protein MOO46_07725 (plasmid) [Apilactobacillus apisilvae]|uniref:YqbQ/XkdQ domain-containing protein n=1 Tax=Apilactobacillus apisilvae TaxID=2923364 RepID=A0ABY4PKH2_9LACO|nr:hypothetical protein [Apilactobacillus apisilvae]UQS85869.1 hypothetical protein MOO46_07725 [Apilactobacillus apisilvae]